VLALLALAGACGEDEKLTPGEAGRTGAAGSAAFGGRGTSHAGSGTGGRGAIASTAGTDLGGAGADAASSGRSSSGKSGTGGRRDASGGNAGSDGRIAGSGGTAVADGGAGEGGEAGAGGSATSDAGGLGFGDAGAGGDRGSGMETMLSISNLAIAPNPNMTISCFVSWTTEEPASSEVDFGAGTYAFRIRDAALVTDHRVLVIGMHAESDYKIKAVSSTGTKSGEAEGTFTTGALPGNLPTPTLTTKNAVTMQPGWTLMNTSGAQAASVMAMYDEDGLPVWYFVDGPGNTQGAIDVEFLGSSVLMSAGSGEPAREVDFSGTILWGGPANPVTTYPQTQTHTISKTSTGNYLLNIDYWIKTPDATWIDALVQEIKPDSTQVWSWHLFDHQPAAGTRGDVCHGNAMTLDEVNNVLYYNCRFLGLLKVDRITGNILWRIGGGYDTTTYGPGDFTFNPPESRFDDAHDPELHDDGTILFYDNGGYNNRPPGGLHSRVVEYQVDEKEKKATRTFEFPGDFSVDPWYSNNWYTPALGSAKRLANGNVLVAAGDPANLKTDTARIFEVTREGEVAWQITLPLGYTVYRARRVSPPPLVSRLP
jgi:hypothetical protein